MISEIVEKELLSIFTYLLDKNYSYCVLTGQYTSFGEHFNDIDLYCEEESLQPFLTYLMKNGWSQTLSFRYGGRRVFFSKQLHAFKLKLDISTEYKVYVDGLESMFKFNPQKVLKNGINYLDDKSALLYKLKKMFMSGDYSQKKMRDINELIYHLGRQGEDWSWVSDLAGNKGGHALTNYFFPIKKSPVSLLLLIKLYFNHWVRPTSVKTVAFVGIDGAGKGTYLDLLEREMKTNNFNVARTYMGHSNYSLMITKYIHEIKVNTNNKWARNAARLAYFLLFPLELLIRRHRGVVDYLLCDRHCLAEPVVINNKKLMEVYNRLLYLLSPRPDMFVYLKGNPKTLWERKKEMDFSLFEMKSADLEDKMKELEKYLYVVTIDTCDKVEDVYEEIRKAIFKG